MGFYQFLFRRGSTASRQARLLSAGEPGWDADEKRLYVGDGVTPGGVATAKLDDLDDFGGNLLINPGFSVWQRGMSFAADGFTADRWFYLRGAGGAATVSRRALELGEIADSAATYCLKIAQTAGASTAPQLRQKIENVRNLAGRRARIAFRAKATAPLTVTPKLAQEFGTGGAPSPTVFVNGTPVALGASWAKYSQTIAVPPIAGKTVGSGGGSALRLYLEFPVGAAFEVEVADFELVDAERLSLVEPRPPALELALCQRYYCVTRATVRFAAAAGGQYGETPIYWPAAMRTAPTVTATAVTTANLRAGSPDIQSPTEFGARFRILSDAAGDCFALSVPVAADAEI